MGGRYFDPKISVGNVLTIIFVVGAIITAWFALGERVALVEKAVAQQETSFERRVTKVEKLQEETDDTVNDIRIELRGIKTTQQHQTETLQRILKAVEQ